MLGWHETEKDFLLQWRHWYSLDMHWLQWRHGFRRSDVLKMTLLAALQQTEVVLYADALSLCLLCLSSVALHHTLLATPETCLQEIPYYSRGSGFFGSFLVIILVNFGLLQLIQDLLDPKIRSWMA